MEKAIINIIAQNLLITQNQVFNTVKLLKQGATVPFISRYRKEATQGLDEVQISNIASELKKLNEIVARKTYILETIDSLNFLNNDLKIKILNCWNSNDLEDIFLPFKPGRKTKADAAKEKGLEPLASVIMQQQQIDLQVIVKKYLTPQVTTADDALAGACDIIAEWINQRLDVRNSLRNLFSKEAEIIVKVAKNKETDGNKYQDYFNFCEKINKIAAHRVLAIFRGEQEGFLKVTIKPDELKSLSIIEKFVVKNSTHSASIIKNCVKDAYKRLLKPSLETECRNLLKNNADDVSITLFQENLRQLLLAPPLGSKRVLGIDPGFKTGCKVVCIDENGNLLHNETIYPHPPQKEKGKAASKINQLVQAYKIQAIAIGNGTAGRETEDFIRYHVKFNSDVEAYVVNEAGASIYSASPVARAEFPQYDVTVRGAVSIARRLMDPLAELVKIDPKSIGVGQYQHDVDQHKLKEALDQTVELCVNGVGVNLQTASTHLLKYVSGIGPKLAENIVAYRTQNGNFLSRNDLKKIPGLGSKAFEQASGFLRIPQSNNPLDNSAVHPERYSLVEKIAQTQGVNVSTLIGNKEKLDSINWNQFISTDVGLPTLTDIKNELLKPGRDPRGKSKLFMFDKNLKSIADLKVNQIYEGIVANVTKFGAFVDLGIKQYGLVHISNVADEFVSNPTDYVKLNQTVRVKVIDIDAVRNRIQLSMKPSDLNT